MRTGVDTSAEKPAGRDTVICNDLKMTDLNGVEKLMSSWARRFHLKQPHESLWSKISATEDTHTNCPLSLQTFSEIWTLSLSISAEMSVDYGPNIK